MDHRLKFRLAAFAAATIALNGLACHRQIDPAGAAKIHNAALAGDLGKVKALLNDNPDLVFSSARGETPLHLAAEKGHKDVAELLLTYKANVSAKDGYGMTPLHWVAMEGHADVVDVLVAHGADVNAKSGEGDVTTSPAGSTTQVVERLDLESATPLHWAAFMDRKDVAELLLANKAEVNAKDIKGQTPTHYAMVKGNASVAKLLRQHGGHE